MKRVRVGEVMCGSILPGALYFKAKDLKSKNGQFKFSSNVYCGGVQANNTPEDAAGDAAKTVEDEAKSAGDEIKK
jgi:hypothetical protein